MPNWPMAKNNHVGSEWSKEFIPHNPKIEWVGKGLKKERLYDLNNLIKTKWILWYS